MSYHGFVQSDQTFPFQLPALYEDILNHPNTSDKLRRATESKLLRHRQRYLYALPTTAEYASEKHAAYKVVEDMASGAVLLGVADELAWSCYMENLDVYDIGEFPGPTRVDFSNCSD